MTRLAKKNKKKIGRAGFSLIEVIVAVLLFSVIMLSSTEIFKMVIESQRSALATQNVQESLKYFLEVISKEIRMAQKNEGVCSGIADDKVFVLVSGTGGYNLRFKNYDEQCVTYSLVPSGDNWRFWIIRDNDEGFISPAKINISTLDFVIKEEIGQRTLVTVNLTAYALGDTRFRSEMTLQTSLTSRYYK